MLLVDVLGPPLILTRLTPATAACLLPRLACVLVIKLTGDSLASEPRSGAE